MNLVSKSDLCIGRASLSVAESHVIEYQCDCSDSARSASNGCDSSHLAFICSIFSTTDVFFR